MWPTVRRGFAARALLYGTCSAPARRRARHSSEGRSSDSARVRSVCSGKGTAKAQRPFGANAGGQTVGRRRLQNDLSALGWPSLWGCCGVRVFFAETQSLLWRSPTKVLHGGSTVHK